MTTCEITYANCPMPVIPMRFPLGLSIDIPVSDLHTASMWVAIVAALALVALVIAGMRYGAPRPVYIVAVGARHRKRRDIRAMLSNVRPVWLANKQQGRHAAK